MVCRCWFWFWVLLVLVLTLLFAFAFVFAFAVELELELGVGVGVRAVVRGCGPCRWGSIVSVGVGAQADLAARQRPDQERHHGEAAHALLQRVSNA